MQLSDNKSISKIFKVKFLWLLIVCLFLIITITWFVSFAVYRREAKALVRYEALTVEKTFSFLLANRGVVDAQNYLTFTQDKRTRILLALYYDKNSKRVIASTEKQWIGKALEDLPQAYIQKDLTNTLETNQNQTWVNKRQGFFDLTFAQPRGVFMIHIASKPMFRSFFYSSIITQAIMGLLFLGIVFICFEVIFAQLFRPFREKLRTMILSSPTYLGKFRKLLRTQNTYRFSFISFIDQFAVDLDEAIRHELWINNLLDQQPVGLLFADNHGKAIFTNQCMNNLLGIPPDQALGDGWTDVIYREDYPATLEVWNQIQKLQENRELQFRFKTPEGLIKWVQVHFAPVYEVSGLCVGAVGTFIAINRYKSFEKEQSTHQRGKNQVIEQKKSDLISIISHQLRTPLSIIEQAVEIIKAAHEAEEREEARKFLLICQNNVHKIIEMVRDMLSYQEIEFGYKNWDMKSVQPALFMQQVFESHEKKFKKKGLKYQLEVADNLPDIVIDIPSLKKALESLIENALSFTEEGEVVLSVFEKQKYVVIEVRDTGIGIRKDDLHRLFTLFSQVHNLDMRFGSGLGLALVKKIIKKHGGEVSIVSEFGVGSTFKLKLPIKEKND